MFSWYVVWGSAYLTALRASEMARSIAKSLEYYFLFLLFLFVLFWVCVVLVVLFGGWVVWCFGGGFGGWVVLVTPPAVGPCFRRNFIPGRPNFAKKQTGLPNHNPKPTPAWLGGGIARSDANPHPGPLSLGR